jgi:hypothetical protein
MYVCMYGWRQTVLNAYRGPGFLAVGPMPTTDSYIQIIFLKLNLGQGKIIIIKPIIACFPMFHSCFQSQINIFLFKILWRCCGGTLEVL